MRKAVKFQVEKITNGYLFTESDDDKEIGKTFSEKKDNLFDLLKENKTVGAIFDEDEELIMFEFIKHDVSVKPVQKSNAELLEQIVQREVFNPFKSKPIDENELRLSVTKQNCYSSDRLKHIDFIKLDEDLSMPNTRKAEICGVKSGTFFSTWHKIKKGGFGYASVDVRVYMTVLAKYYEITLGVRTSKKEELERVRDGVIEQIKELDILFKKNNHIHSNAVEPVIFELKKLIKYEE